MSDDIKDLVIEFRKLNHTIEKLENNILEIKNKMFGISPTYVDLFLDKVPFNELTREHVCPKTKQGSGEKGNIIYISKRINQLKADKTKQLQIDNIYFSILTSKTNGNLKNGTLKILKENLNLTYKLEKKYYDFWLENNLIKKDNITERNKIYLLISTEKENERYFNFKKMYKID